MGRGRDNGDPVSTEYRQACNRANALFALAVLFCIAWGAAVFVGSENASQVSAAFNSLVRTVFGWGSITALALSLLHGAYAIVFFYLKIGRW